MLSWIGVTCDRSGRTELLDNQEAAVALDHPLHLGELVARENDEAGAVRAHPFVLGRADLERLGALRVAALADEQAHARPARGAGEIGDVLVHLAKDNLVAGVLLEGGAHGIHRLAPAVVQSACSIGINTQTPFWPVA